MKYKLQDLIDIELFQNLQSRLNEIYSFPSAIIDNESNILTAFAWQDICIQFHRKNEETKQNCHKSDKYILDHLDNANPAAIYRCPNGLIECATPIIIDGVHYGNFFTGQFFLKKPDLNFFRAQAHKYGFDEGTYLEAVQKVPFWTQEQLNNYLYVIKVLIAVISEGGLKKIKEIETRKQIERIKERADTILSQMHEGLIIMNPHNGQVNDVNEAMCRMLGYTYDEILKLKVADFEAIESPAEMVQRTAHILETGSAHFESKYRRKDGTLFDVEISITYLHNQDLSFGFYRDITDWKRAQYALNHSHDLMRYIIEHNRSSIAVHDRDMRYLYVSRNYLDVYKIKDRDIIGKHHYEVFPDLPQKWKDVQQRVLAGEVMSAEDDPYFREDGTVDWTRWECRPWYEANGSIGGIILYTEVITERKRIESALRALAETGGGTEENIFRFLVHELAQAFGVRHAFIAEIEPHDPDTARMLAVWKDGVFAENFMYSLPGTPCQDVMAQSAGIYPRNVRALFPQARFLEEMNAESFMGTPVKNSAGKVLGIIAVFHDREMEEQPQTFSLLNSFAARAGAEIERKQAEDAFQESEKRFRTLIEQAGDGFEVLDLKGRFVDLNSATCRMLGYTREELLGMSILDIDPNFDSEALRQFIQKMPSDRPIILETTHRRKDGTVYPVEINSSPIQMGGLTLIFSTVRDITERKRAETERAKLEAQFLQAQKMEAVGRLAGGVAHDFNNMLSVILLHTEAALTKLDPSDPLYADLEEIQKAGKRSADLTRQLLAFARKQTVAPKVLNLNETVEGTLKMLRRLIGEDISLSWNPGPALRQIHIDPTQIDQILANLCVNARDAITDIGRVYIETANVVFEDAYCADHAECLPGEYVMLAISDTGCGMDKVTLSKIFEPFFTTKESGKGTGLGLATVYGIVKQNNGFINVYSEPGEGTTIKIYLPPYAGADEKAAPESRTEIITGGPETILLVEDEPAILKMGKIILEQLGYTVLSAATPGEAIKLADECKGRIDLLMTDVVMPEMNGRDLSERLLSLYPHMKRLFMSGYTSDVVVHHGVWEDGVNFIQKPFSMKDLAAKVRETISGR